MEEEAANLLRHFGAALSSRVGAVTAEELLASTVKETAAAKAVRTAVAYCEVAATATGALAWIHANGMPTTWFVHAELHEGGRRRRRSESL